MSVWNAARNSRDQTHPKNVRRAVALIWKWLK